ncbi:hypothetical protein E1A91_D11G204200v1 [Gossypium mustelinum]|uniref:Uncharacterized protein n=1 Tax=Gossypium mustelinum TaxID=34275 RepID=A0A5D2SUK6_GOSMU|nr:hypothetical protein E1A91_D11G204200v1 [Gossypium mustelinum]
MACLPHCLSPRHFRRTLKIPIERKKIRSVSLTSLQSSFPVCRVIWRNHKYIYVCLIRLPFTVFSPIRNP